MSLLDLKTDLKSLKFGTPPASDRPGGGNSGQPYITDPISSDIIPQSEDFLLRGGLNAPLDAANDVVRLTKMFGDLKSPSGILFVAKQNLLSRIAVNTQASGKGVNEGVYTPLTTLAQAGVGFAGGHLSKQGLNPLSGVKTYGPKSLFNPQGSTVIGDVIGEPDGEGNRLVGLYNTQIPNSGNDFSIEDQVNVYSYPGGPGSKLGIGKTNIRFATDNKGAPLLSGIATKDYQAGIGKSGTDFSKIIIDGVSQNPLKGQIYRQTLGTSDIWLNSVLGEKNVTNNIKENFTGVSQGNSGGRKITNSSVYVNSTSNPGDRLSGPAFKGFFPLMTNRERDNNTLTFSQNQIISIGVEGNSNNPFQDLGWTKNTNEGYNSPKTLDFRKPLIDNLRDPKSSTIMSFSPSYKPNEGKTKAIDGTAGSRINMTSPGQQGNIINYSKGKIIDGTRVSVVDYINFQPLYKSSDVKKEKDISKNDLIKFRIGAVLRDGDQVFMHFRAFINQFSDSYSAKWSGIQYMGRGEELYKYGGFGRKITLSYTVAAQSKPELMAQYKKLNFLASTLAPDYGGSGYMGGVLTTLTLGGWCYELPGFIDSLTLDIPQESPWEIAIPATEKDADGGNPIYSDKTVKEMPHICNVNMSFTPIHTFRPELQKNGYGPGKKPDGKGEVSEYGQQHYLSLTNGYNNNYVPVSLKDAQTPNTKQST